MKIIELTNHEKQIANYLVELNKAKINKIANDCISPLIAVRQVCKKTVENIGRTELLLEKPLSRDEWYKITKWIYQVYFK